MKFKSHILPYFLGLTIFLSIPGFLNAQSGNEEALTIQTGTRYQTVVGFGAALAYYEGWLNAHPNKAEIYEAIFGELSLDILRVRNAHDYDPGMVTRVQEYVEASEKVLGYPISVMSVSWGPPGYLKSNNDRSNGGTLRYSVEGGKTLFDYAGFAHWWKSSLEEYHAHGIFPDYISIQNEPDWKAPYESCLLYPKERITTTDTIAGYDRALVAVYDTLANMERRPAILGPETVGMGYDNVERYVNNLDVSRLDGISHHLYHGVDENNPYASTDFAKVGNLYPELPHFQTEYDRGDWFSLAGLIYKSFYDEKVVAYLYWPLIWESGGLVTLDFPWDRSRWIDPEKGYTKTKDFYAFKQFSAFIQPGWKMTGHALTGTDGASLTFINPEGDSATCVVINRSSTSEMAVHVDVPGYRITESLVYRTSDSENCLLLGTLTDSLFTATAHSITTVAMQLSPYDPSLDTVAPSIPENLSLAEATTRSLAFTWDPSTDSVGVEGYRIYLDGILHGTSPDTSYVVTGLDPATAYEISVSAFDHVPNESQSSLPVSATTLPPDTEAPSIPGNLSAGSVSQTSVELAWDPSTDDTGVTAYRIFANGMWMDTAYDTSFSVTLLIPGTTYQFTVAAFDEAGNESEPSDAVTVMTLVVPDEEPPVLEATDSLHVEGTVEATSSEDGSIYLVPDGTPAQIDAIRGATIDSVEAAAGIAVQFSISGLPNGIYLLFATDSAGNISLPEAVTIFGVGIGQFSVDHFNAYPNPFSQSTTLQFSLMEGERMWLKVIDALGKQVMQRSLGEFPAGAHRLLIPRDGLREGLYFFRLENSAGEGWSRRMIIQE